MRNAGGFVAGTLVHTDKGLVLIDQLKVGDMVLSKHESGEGETACKRVVRTFKSETKQKIMSPLEGVYSIDNHPFWVLGKGWVAANQLDQDTDEIYWLQSKDPQHDGAPAYYSLSENKDPFGVGGLYLVRTAAEGVGLEFISNYCGFCASEQKTTLIDFNSGSPREIVTNGYDSTFGPHPTLYSSYEEIPASADYLFFHRDYDELEVAYYRYILLEALSHAHGNGQVIEENAYYDYVYNIEVEDYHTYFVTKYGYWAHA